MHSTARCCSKMLTLGEKDVRRCLSMKECIEANRKALTSLQKTPPGDDSTRCIVPTRLALPYGTGAPQDWTLFKPAAFYSPSETLMGMKVVSVRSQNRLLNKPMVPATVMLVDAQSGETQALLGGTYLTAARTAAGSALATEICCSDSRRLVVFGAGLQAECHVNALQCVQPSIQHIAIVNRGKERAECLAKMINTNYPQISVEIVMLHDKEAVKRIVSLADVIAACTNTRTPLWDGSWLRPGCHVNGIGSYTPDMQEVDEQTVNRSRVLIDTLEALQVGDLKHLSSSDGHPWELLGGALHRQDWTDRDADDESIDCTFYKAVGTAIQDVITGQLVIERAKELGIGTMVDMS